MKTQTKKKYVYGLIALLLAFILAVFCIPSSDKKKANAYDGTFYFRADPVVSATATDGRYPIRFNLIVSNAALASTDSITVSLSSNSSSAYIMRGHDGTTLTETESASQSVTFAYSVLVFEDGFASVYVDMYLNVYEKGRLTATCASTSAVSDEHTVVSAIEIAARDGYREQGGLTSDGARSLAKIYDKYAGKDTTTDKGSLSFVSNILPVAYGDNYTNYMVELEIPANIAKILKNNTEYTENFYNDGLVGTYVDVSCKYYTLCLSGALNTPSKYSSLDLANNASAVFDRNFYYSQSGKNWSNFYHYVQTGGGGSADKLSSYISSIVNGYSPGNLLSKVATAYPISLGEDSAKKDISFSSSAYLSQSATNDIYVYAEVLEYSYDFRVEILDSNYTLDYSKYSINSLYRSDVIHTTKKQMNENVLTNNPTLNSGEVYAFCSRGNISTTETKPLEVIYKTYSDSGNYQTQSEVYEISQANIYNKYSAINAMYNLSGITDVAHFNIVSTRRSYDSVTGNLYNMGDIIIRQALGYDYYYDKDEGKAYLTVLYSDFLYKDFYITIRNEENLQINYYTANVEVKDGVATLIFDYADIRERLYNSVKWIFEVNKDSFTITGSSDVMLGVDVGEKDLRVSVPVKYQSDLFDLGIHAVATIVPDEEYAVEYEYATSIDVSADGKDIELQTEIVSGGGLMLSRIINYNNYDIFMKEQGDMVEYALKKFEKKYGVSYAKVADVYVGKPDTVNKTVNILVTYDTNALFLIKNNLNDNWTYKQVSHSTNVYNGNEFVDALGEIPSGYRVDNIAGGVSGISVKNSYDYHATRVVLNAETYGSHIYLITVNYTDKWFVTVNWMQPYKDTPFAVKTKTDAEIRVLDYPDIYALTKEDVAKILGRENLVVAGMVDANAPKVTFDNVATYTIDISYGVASLKQIDYDGHANELKIPLTSYVDWCNSFGEDWTILFLNTKDKQYFQYSNDVEREDLYGFFAVAVFEEQVSDLNYWFRNNTGDGQMTIFDTRTVQGSKIYQFFDNMTTKGIISKAIGTIGMALCEIVNDDNAIHQSYYFYLDGSTKNGYISNGGADDAFDDDSALENKGEDIVDDVKDTLGNLTDRGKSLWQRFRDSKWDTVVVVVLCVVAGVIVLGISIKYGKRFYVWVTAKPKNKTTKKKKSASKKK